jgi:hypothetical protein
MVFKFKLKLNGPKNNLFFSPYYGPFFEMEHIFGLCIKRCTQPFLLRSLKNLRYYNHGSANVETRINQQKKIL